MRLVPVCCHSAVLWIITIQFYRRHVVVPVWCDGRIPDSRRTRPTRSSATQMEAIPIGELKWDCDTVRGSPKVATWRQAVSDRTVHRFLPHPPGAWWKTDPLPLTREGHVFSRPSRNKKPRLVSLSSHLTHNQTQAFQMGADQLSKSHIGLVGVFGSSAMSSGVSSSSSGRIDSMYSVIFFSSSSRLYASRYPMGDADAYSSSMRGPRHSMISS
jgi:hypothetical protein